MLKSHFHSTFVNFQNARNLLEKENQEKWITWGVEKNFL